MKVFVLAAALLLAAPAYASDATDVLAAIHTFTDGINKGDMKAAASVYAADATIIDEFPPHIWRGAHAFGDWGASFEADAKAHGVSDVKILLAKPRHVNVEGDRAYVVVPTTLTSKVHGKPGKELGTFTFAMQKTEGLWQIDGWAWATK
jgi:ketosteroid isomerase-like protein